MDCVHAAFLLNDGTLSRKLGIGGSLAGCLVAITSLGDYVMLARGNRLVLVSVSRGGVLEYQVVDQDDFADDPVTAIEFVDVPQLSSSATSRTKSSSGAFLCGTAKGYLRWLMLDGRLAMSHQMHDSAVVHIKPQGSIAVLFEKGVLVLLDEDGVVAALQASMIRSGPLAGANTRALSYQKFELEGQRLLNDLIICNGAESPDPWSVYRKDRSAVHIVGGGGFPMLGVYVPRDRHGRLSTAVAMASEITSKLTSAVFSMAKSWWSSGNEFGAPSPQKVAPVAEAKTLDMSWGLGDATREVRVLALAPTGNLAVACDNFGRILLLDLQLYVLVRLWKGYRDAQVAWVQQDNLLFLVVYAPRRGVMEIWRMRHGHREVIMDVGMDCTLIQAGNADCFLLRSSGELQRIRYSTQMSEYLKQDQVTLELIRKRDGNDVIGLIERMHHPRMLVQAVLSLTRQDPSELFLKATSTALAQCNVDHTTSQIVLNQDVAQLTWLDRYVRAYRLLEKGNALSCRQFLWCFSVQGTEEGRLTASITPEIRLQLAQTFFQCDADRLQEALSLTRLSFDDAELLLADFFILSETASSEEHQLSLLRFFISWTKTRSPVLAQLLRRVCETTVLERAQQVVHLVGQCVTTDSLWNEARDRLQALLLIGRSEHYQPSVAAAVEGSFSLFRVLAVSTSSELLAAFPEHAKQTDLVAAHVCLEKMREWQTTLGSSKQAALSVSMINTTVDDDSDAEHAANPLSDDEVASIASEILTAAMSIIQQQKSGPLTLHFWTNYLSPVFWKCAGLIELGRKSPSENTVARFVNMSGLKEFEHFLVSTRDCLKLIVNSWDMQGVPKLSELPFPQHPDPEYKLAMQKWSDKSGDDLQNLKEVHLLSRAVCSVLKYGLKGVSVSCVLSKESPHRERINAAKKNPDFVREQFVLRLLPHNNSLAVNFAKSLNVDLDTVRKLANSIEN